MTTIRNPASTRSGLAPWAQLVGWATVVGSGITELVQLRLGAAMPHRQPLLILVGFLSLMTAHVWLLVASVWLVRRWWSGLGPPPVDRLLYGLVALEVAYPYVMDLFRFGL
jgi:hypothetical protein